MRSRPVFFCRGDGLRCTRLKGIEAIHLHSESALDDEQVDGAEPTANLMLLLTAIFSAFLALCPVRPKSRNQGAAGIELDAAT